MVDVKVRKIKAGKYAADGEYTGNAYTIKKYYYGWEVMVGYGNQKERLDKYKRHKTKRSAVERIEEVEGLAWGAAECREMGLEIEKKIKVLDSSTVFGGGLMGGQNWTMLTRLRIDGEPITGWVSGKNVVPSEERESEVLSRRARAEGYEVSPYHIRGLERMASEEYKEKHETTRVPWAGSSGSGLSRGKRHWILK